MESMLTALGQQRFVDVLLAALGPATRREGDAASLPDVLSRIDVR